MNLKKIMSGAAAFIMTASLMTSYPTGCFKGLVAPVTVGAEESVIASGECGENLTWKLTTDGVLTISGSGNMYNYNPLLEKYAEWEDYKQNIKTIIISENVTSIGDYTFDSCTNLVSVYFPSSLKMIYRNAFSNCVKLESITIPYSVSSIGQQAFFNCTALSNVTIAIETTIGSKAFSNCSSNLVYNYEGSCGPNATYTLDSQGNLVISGSGDINDSAFKGNESIKNVIIGDEITVIRKEAFSGCVNIISVTIGEKVNTIVKWAFKDCKKLENITIPNSVSSVNDDILFNCSNLGSITAPCGIKKTLSLSEHKDKINYTHAELDANCVCTKCKEPLHTYTTDPHKCDKCEDTSVHTDADKNSNCDICGKDIVRIKVGSDDEKIYIFGDSVTITAPTAETGMTFDCWTAPNGKVVSRDAEYTFNAVIDSEFVPQYSVSESSQEMTVLWVSLNNQEMKREIVKSAEELANLVTPDIPSKLGYTDGKWVLKSDSVTEFTNGAVMTFIPEYTKELTFTITVIDNSGNETSTEYKPNDIAKVTAEEIEGKTFSYWVVKNVNGEEKPVCYTPVYSFYVANGMTLKAVYNETVEEKGTANLVSVNYADSKLTVVSQLAIPNSDYKMVHAGLLATKDSSIKDILSEKNASYVKGGSNLPYSSYRYTWNLKTTKSATWYVRAYLVYTTPDGKTETVYGDIVEYTITL